MQKKEMKEKTKVSISIATAVVLFVVLQIFIIISDRLNISSYNGVLMACQFAVCLLAVRSDYKKGIICSSILMGISLVSLANAILFQHVYSALPGLCNSIIYLASLIMLAIQFGVREKESRTDFLTGLLNRRGLYRVLKEKTEIGKPFNVIYVDLGNFKFINDNYGHAYGDFLMKEVTRRMAVVVKKNGIITRIGGDEFVVILDGKVDPAELANEIIDRICEKAEITIGNSNVDCYLSACAGIANFPNDTTNYEALIKYSDIAMFQATNDKTKICFFNKEMEQHLQREMELEKLINDGLANDYFFLMYQPQFELGGKKLRGFESLLRLKTPEGNLVSPGEFIPVAEKGDLILQIDDYVIKRAMTEFKNVIAEKEDLTISVNVSAKNIGGINFTKKIKKALEETNFPAKNLEIEITEYCLVESVDDTIANIKELRNMGVQIALDDFGTGYTSLSYLSKMPINLLKIDKSLIDDIEKDEKRRDFVHAVISMGHLMGCEVISEGVENEEQLEILSKQECDFIQGFVWGKPLDYEVAKGL